MVSSSAHGQSLPSPFRPGSIFYHDQSVSLDPSTRDRRNPSPQHDRNNHAHTTDKAEAGRGLLKLAEPATHSLASPPPSPSRNSIFDQPWAGTSGPNISSLRASSSFSASSHPTLHPDRRSGNASGNSSSAPDKGRSGNTDNSYGAKMHVHTKSYQPIGDNSTVETIAARSFSSGSSTTVNSNANHDRLAISDVAKGATDSTASAVPHTLLSPIYVPQRPPSPLLSPSLPSLSMPLAPLFVGTSASQELFRGEGPFSLSLECSRANLLGHGRHAEVYRALVHPLSAPMRQYLLSRRATRGMTCMDLLQETNGETVKNEPFVCAAKRLFADTDSQTVGLAEAKILRRLHSQQAQHPGRQFLVGYIGLYDQATKTAISILDGAQHDLATDSETLGGEWTLLLEYCQHGSIWDYIRLHPERIGFRQWLEWAIQLLQAVDCIHEAGLVHHDIKPHNILLDSSLDAKLSDFGASAFLNLGGTSVHGATAGWRSEPHFVLEEGRGRGTPPYTAPEMFASASSDAHYDQSIDIYSLGVSLYVIGLTAQEPFHKLKSVMEMVIWIKKGGFWLWEDQGWIHDRGHVPKITKSSRLSTSSAALAQAQAQSHQDSKSKAQDSSRPSRSSSVSSNVPALKLPPINTQLTVDRSALSPSSVYSVNSPAASQFLSGYSPERFARASQPSTPVSPLPLPSPLVRSQASRPTQRKDERRKSGEVVMRFLNGEVVQPEVIMLLKEMCNTDPDQRPGAKVVLERLQQMKEQLDREIEEDQEQEQDVNMETIH